MMALSMAQRNSGIRQLFIFAAVLFLFSLWSWNHFYGLPNRVAAHVRKTNSHVKQRYWTTSSKDQSEGIETFKRPKDIDKIVGLIFYGRPATVSILDCYLKRNLVKNGGMLDEVVWIIRTNHTQDIAWLETLVKTEPSYTTWNINFVGADQDYRSAYDRIENGTMYIKMDDDIVFMEDTAIPSIVHTKYTHPEWYIVSANIMNMPSLSWVHYSLGAVHPYLPELDPPSPSEPIPEDSSVSWKTSDLPKWRDPDPQKSFKLSWEWKSPFSKHRWLPVEFNAETDKTIDETPIVNTKFDAFGDGLWHWQVGAQEHYSFFQNLEQNELWRYKFHSWDYNYTRMGIQFIAMMGEDINLGKPMKMIDDEYYFSQYMTKKTRRHGVVDGRAVVSHYSFKPQITGMDSTDILDRYRAYAREFICTSELI